MTNIIYNQFKAQLADGTYRWNTQPDVDTAGSRVKFALMKPAADDVDDTAAKVESPGGSAEVPLADILGIDRFAGLKDPQGAMFFIFKSAS